MSATVRLGRVVAATAVAATSTVHVTGTASLGAATFVRVADVSAHAASSLAAVRIAQVGAVSAAGGTVRIGDVTASAVQSGRVWNGTTWQTVPPTGVSNLITRSQGALTVTVTVSATGRLTAKSTGSGVLTASGTLALVAGGTLGLSGAQVLPGSGSGVLGLSGTGTLTITGSASQGPPGQGSLTVAAQPLNSPPRVLLSLAGALGTTVTIVRIDAAGGQTPVRLANPAALNAGGWVGYDYEAPFGETVSYQATTTLIITSDPVTLNVSTPWLIHPGIPDLSLPLHIANVGDQTRATNQSVQYAMGRRNPIIQTDGVRHAPAFDLTVATSTVSDREALTTLLDDTTVLLLQIGYADMAERDYMWVAVGDAVQTRVTAFYGDPHRMWTLPCTVTDPPSGLLQAQRAWRDVLAEFSTWRDDVAAYATWRDVITDNRIDD